MNDDASISPERAGQVTASSLARRSNAPGAAAELLSTHLRTAEKHSSSNVHDEEHASVPSILRCLDLSCLTLDYEFACLFSIARLCPHLLSIDLSGCSVPEKCVPQLVQGLNRNPHLPSITTTGLLVLGSTGRAIAPQRRDDIAQQLEAMVQVNFVNSVRQRERRRQLQFEKHSRNSDKYLLETSAVLLRGHQNFIMSLVFVEENEREQLKAAMAYVWKLENKRLGLKRAEAAVLRDARVLFAQQREGRAVIVEQQDAAALRLLFRFEELQRDEILSDLASAHRALLQHRTTSSETHANLAQLRLRHCAHRRATFVRQVLQSRNQLVADEREAFGALRGSHFQRTTEMLHAAVSNQAQLKDAQRVEQQVRYEQFRKRILDLEMERLDRSAARQAASTSRLAIFESEMKERGDVVENETKIFDLLKDVQLVIRECEAEKTKVDILIREACVAHCFVPRIVFHTKRSTLNPIFGYRDAGVWLDVDSSCHVTLEPPPQYYTDAEAAREQLKFAFSNSRKNRLVRTKQLKMCWHAIVTLYNSAKMSDMSFLPKPDPAAGGDGSGGSKRQRGNQSKRAGAGGGGGGGGGVGAMANSYSGNANSGKPVTAQQQAQMMQAAMYELPPELRALAPPKTLDDCPDEQERCPPLLVKTIEAVAAERCQPQNYNITAEIAVRLIFGVVEPSRHQQSELRESCALAFGAAKQRSHQSKTASASTPAGSVTPPAPATATADVPAVDDDPNGEKLAQKIAEMALDKRPLLLRVTFSTPSNLQDDVSAVVQKCQLLALQRRDLTKMAPVHVDPDRGWTIEKIISEMHRPTGDAIGDERALDIFRAESAVNYYNIEWKWTVAFAEGCSDEELAAAKKKEKEERERLQQQAEQEEAEELRRQQEEYEKEQQQQQSHPEERLDSFNSANFDPAAGAASTIPASLSTLITLVRTNSILCAAKERPPDPTQHHVEYPIFNKGQDRISVFTAPVVLLQATWFPKSYFRSARQIGEGSKPIKLAKHGWLVAPVWQVLIGEENAAAERRNALLFGKASSTSREPLPPSPQLMWSRSSYVTGLFSDKTYHGFKGCTLEVRIHNIENGDRIILETGSNHWVSAHGSLLRAGASANSDALAEIELGTFSSLNERKLHRLVFSSTVDVDEHDVTAVLNMIRFKNVNRRPAESIRVLEIQLSMPAPSRGGQLMPGPKFRFEIDLRAPDTLPTLICPTKTVSFRVPQQPNFGNWFNIKDFDFEKLSQILFGSAAAAAPPSTAAAGGGKSAAAAAAKKAKRVQANSPWLNSVSLEELVDMSQSNATAPAAHLFPDITVTCPDTCTFKGARVTLNLRAGRVADHLWLALPDRPAVLELPGYIFAVLTTAATTTTQEDSTMPDSAAAISTTATTAAAAAAPAPAATLEEALATGAPYRYATAFVVDIYKRAIPVAHLSCSFYTLEELGLKKVKKLRRRGSSVLIGAGIGSDKDDDEESDDDVAATSASATAKKPLSRVGSFAFDASTTPFSHSGAPSGGLQRPPSSASAASPGGLQRRRSSSSMATLLSPPPQRLQGKSLHRATSAERAAAHEARQQKMGAEVLQRLQGEARRQQQEGGEDPLKDRDRLGVREITMDLMCDVEPAVIEQLLHSARYSTLTPYQTEFGGRDIQLSLTWHNSSKATPGQVRRRKKRTNVMEATVRANILNSLLRPPVVSSAIVPGGLAIKKSGAGAITRTVPETVIDVAKGMAQVTPLELPEQPEDNAIIETKQFPTGTFLRFDLVGNWETGDELRIDKPMPPPENKASVATAAAAAASSGVAGAGGGGGAPLAPEPPALPDLSRWTVEDLPHDAGLVHIWLNDIKRSVWEPQLERRDLFARADPRLGKTAMPFIERPPCSDPECVMEYTRTRQLCVARGSGQIEVEQFWFAEWKKRCERRHAPAAGAMGETEADWPWPPFAAFTEVFVAPDAGNLLTAWASGIFGSSMSGETAAAAVASSAGTLLAENSFFGDNSHNNDSMRRVSSNNDNKTGPLTMKLRGGLSAARANIPRAMVSKPSIDFFRENAFSRFFFESPDDVYVYCIKRGVHTICKVYVCPRSVLFVTTSPKIDKRDIYAMSLMVQVGCSRALPMHTRKLGAWTLFDGSSHSTYPVPIRVNPIARPIPLSMKNAPKSRLYRFAALPLPRLAQLLTSIEVAPAPAASSEAGALVSSQQQQRIVSPSSSTKQIDLYLEKLRVIAMQAAASQRNSEREAPMMDGAFRPFSIHDLEFKTPDEYFTWANGCYVGFDASYPCEHDVFGIMTVSAQVEFFREFLRTKMYDDDDDMPVPMLAVVPMLSGDDSEAAMRLHADILSSNLLSQQVSGSLERTPKQTIMSLPPTISKATLRLLDVTAYKKACSEPVTVYVDVQVATTPRHPDHHQQQQSPGNGRRYSELEAAREQARADLLLAVEKQQQRQQEVVIEEASRRRKRRRMRIATPRRCTTFLDAVLGAGMMEAFTRNSNDTIVTALDLLDIVAEEQRELQQRQLVQHTQIAFEDALAMSCVGFGDHENDDDDDESSRDTNATASCPSSTDGTAAEESKRHFFCGEDSLEQQQQQPSDDVRAGFASSSSCAALKLVVESAPERSRRLLPALSILIESAATSPGSSPTSSANLCGADSISSMIANVGSFHFASTSLSNKKPQAKAVSRIGAKQGGAVLARPPAASVAPRRSVDAPEFGALLGETITIGAAGSSFPSLAQSLGTTALQVDAEDNNSGRCDERQQQQEDEHAAALSALSILRKVAAVSSRFHFPALWIIRASTATGEQNTMVLTDEEAWEETEPQESCHQDRKNKSDNKSSIRQTLSMEEPLSFPRQRRSFSINNNNSNNQNDDDDGPTTDHVVASGAVKQRSKIVSFIARANQPEMKTISVARTEYVPFMSAMDILHSVSREAREGALRQAALDAFAQSAASLSFASPTAGAAATAATASKPGGGRGGGGGGRGGRGAGATAGQEEKEKLAAAAAAAAAAVNSVVSNGMELSALDLMQAEIINERLLRHSVELGVLQPGKSKNKRTGASFLLNLQEPETLRERVRRKSKAYVPVNACLLNLVASTVAWAPSADKWIPAEAVIGPRAFKVQLYDRFIPGTSMANAKLRAAPPAFSLSAFDWSSGNFAPSTHLPAASGVNAGKNFFSVPPTLFAAADIFPVDGCSALALFMTDETIAACGGVQLVVAPSLAAASMYSPWSMKKTPAGLTFSANVAGRANASRARIVHESPTGVIVQIDGVLPTPQWLAEMSKIVVLGPEQVAKAKERGAMSMSFWCVFSTGGVCNACKMILAL